MKRADRRKFHYIYKITRVETGQFYIGMHSTDDLDDGYFGSGKIITASIKKHGKEKHTKEIIETLPSREALKLRERELVNEELLNNKLCMNLKLGGEGGFTTKMTLKGWEASDRRSRQSESMKANWGKNPQRREEYAAFNAAKLKLQHAAGRMSYGNWLGLSHTEESKAKIGAANAISQAGEKNSQYGTCWVTNGTSTIKIKKVDLQEYLDKGYIRGRKIR